VTGIAPGDRVLGLAKFGGYAEEICLPVRAVRRLPPSLDYQEAAALPVNYLTAWFCLFSMGNLQPGDRLLVHGGAGGVGVAAIQLALEHPVEIFSTVGSERKKRFLNELGVKHVINYKRIDFTDYIREQTNQEGVEVILDSVGADNLCRSYEILAPMGRLVSYGLSAAAPDEKKSRFQVFRAWWRTPRFTSLQLIGKNVGVFGFHLALLGTKEGLIQDAIDTLLHKVEVGTIRPVISATFQLSAEGVIQAHEYLHERRNMGKVILVRQGR
jgi:NADPH:quinone reductase-like Zn-dependent oxidoreductase